MPALLPCPFCGSRGIMLSNPEGYAMAVCAHSMCGVRTRLLDVSTKEGGVQKAIEYAAAAWNRRA